MKYALIGEKLGHSFSPEIHAELADYEYSLKEIPRDELDTFMRKRDFLGLNVTIPYKELVIPYLDGVDDAAREIGAVNTVISRDGRLFGYNTDFFGMCALFSHAGIDVKGKKAAVLGSGGTAKTARAVLKSLGACEILTVSRTNSEDTVSYSELYSRHRDTEIIVNTTPVGMFPKLDASPIELSSFTRLSGVIDAVYNPLRTRLVSEAQTLEIKAEGGLYMLIAQAYRASEIFTGKEYDKAELERVYKKLLSGKESVVLTGMPSSGKSTLGRELAELLGREFLDTDTMIEEKSGIKISEIFRTRGEEYFRDLETSVIKEASKRSSLVIATGGGAVLRKENICALKQNGRIVFLDRELSELMPTDDRPLALDRAAIEKRYTERYPIYTASADISVKVVGSPRELAEKIIKELTL